MSAPTIDAVDQLDTDAQRAPVPAARIVRSGGPTAIHFRTRGDFAAWADYGLIAIDTSPRLLPDVDWVAREVRVPVTFGHPVAWPAMATYPTQAPCPCAAEVVHQVGCPADEPAPVDWATAPECDDCGVLNGAHQSSCWRAFRRREVQIVDVLTVDPDLTVVDVAAGHLLDAAAQIPVTVIDLPQRTPGAALIGNPAPGVEAAR